MGTDHFLNQISLVITALNGLNRPGFNRAVKTG